MKPFARGAARRIAERTRVRRIAQQALHRLDEHLAVGMHVAVFAVAYDSGEFSRRKADDRHADRHRFDDREAEARPADRIEKEAVARAKGGEFEIRYFADAAALRRIHADEVERYALAHRLEQVRAEPAAAPRQMVDDDDAALQFAAVLHVFR